MTIREEIEAAIAKISADTSYTVCVGSNQHLIHPDEWRRAQAGEHVVTLCANCFAPIEFNRD